MNLELSQEQVAVREWSRNFAKEVVLPAVEGRREELLSRDLLARLQSEGFMNLCVPENLGGGALGSVEFSLVLTEMARVCASTSVSIAVTNMIADVLVREGSPSQQRTRAVPMLRLCRLER